MKSTTLNSVFACLLSVCSFAWADQPNLPKQLNPRIEFAQKMDGEQMPGGRQCSIGIPESGHKLNKMSDTVCKNDVVTFFRFVDVPSTTNVHLSSERSCSGGDWTFGVRAIKHPTTSKWVDIRNLVDVKEGTIIQPGLIKSHDRYSSGNIEGELSCAVVYAPGGSASVAEGERP
ncbi:hypothetical protein [Pseudomonas sp. CM27]|uniref:hypothetical protein n=1 Tax=Pseudomonas sp. CM27 TaxID=2738452 RepID=UPI0015581651|nr:hypothetical protein [Pseudomonas sp. CM27]NQD78224.1 hypothetical protein [Pseudomonas sp. CM27]